MPFLKEEKSEHERARTSMLAVQLCCARHCELPLSKMGNKGLFPGVAVPLAFFCTLFFRHRKKSVSAPWDGKSQSAPESARQAPTGESLCGASRGLSSGQTIGAVRTAVRPACCLPELWVANRLRRLCPRGTRFPSFPPAPLRGVGVSMGQGVCACGRTGGFPLAPLHPLRIAA